MTIKLIALAIPLIFLISCDIKSVQTPKEVGTFQDRELIDTFLNDIENKFQNINVTVDVRKLPVIVTDTLTSEIGGECHYGHYIAINKIIIHDNQSTLGNSELWHTLLHEIGHCYFHLEHYDKQIKAPSGTMFAIKSTKDGVHKNSNCFTEYRENLSGTVMSTNYLSYTNSEYLKQFYVNEISGKVDDSTLLSMEGIRLIEINGQVNNTCD